MATGIVNPYAVAAGGLSYEDECLADSPVGLWMMNETSGTTIVNQGSSGTAGNGSYGTTYPPVLAGKTLFGLTTPEFRTSSWDFVDMTYPVGFTPDAGLTGAATWEYLFRVDGPVGGWHFGIYPALNAFMAIINATGQFSAQIIATSGAAVMYIYTASGAVVSGTEYHCVVTYDRAAPRLEIWLNGVSVASITTLNYAGSTGTAALTQAVGNYSRTPGAPGGMDGSIGGYAMYAGGLSNARIADH
jgi:hypothetical protein